MRLFGRLAILLLSASAPVVACSSSSQSAGGGNDASVEASGDATIESGDDMGEIDAPQGDAAPPACPCGEAFTTCPAARPCVIGVATTPSCAGRVCCGPASDCDGGAEAGEDAATRDGAADASPDSSHAPSDAGAEAGRDAGAPRDAGGGD